VECQVTPREDTLDVNAKRSADGRTLALHVVNPTEMAIPAQIHLVGFPGIQEHGRAIKRRGTATAPMAAWVTWCQLRLHFSSPFSERAAI
jgi:hypothetical protein